MRASERASLDDFHKNRHLLYFTPSSALFFCNESYNPSSLVAVQKERASSPDDPTALSLLLATRSPTHHNQTMSLSPSKRKLPHSTSPPPSYHIIKPINGGGQSAFPGRGRSLVNDDEGALWGAGRVLGSGEVVGEKKEEIGSR